MKRDRLKGQWYTWHWIWKEQCCVIQRPPYAQLPTFSGKLIAICGNQKLLCHCSAKKNRFENVNILSIAFLPPNFEQTADSLCLPGHFLTRIPNQTPRQTRSWFLTFYILRLTSELMSCLGRTDARIIMSAANWATTFWTLQRILLN